MKIAVIVTNFGAAVNIGGSAETEVRIFDAPEDLTKYVTDARKDEYTTVGLAFGASEEPTNGD